MAKRVVIVASGETERRAIPHLVSHLRDRGIAAGDVRIPGRNKALDVGIAEKLIKSAWYENPAAPPDKFVILVDLDGADPGAVLRPFQKQLPRRLGEVKAGLHYAYAQWHLEAWYFADAENLREHLGGAPGRVDTTRPDDIPNPKQHLKNLLDRRTYTARVSEEIAKNLDAPTIAGRSPSFRGFLDAVANGPSRAPDGAAGALS